MFLVDQDQAQVGQRREHRRARADDHVEPAAAGALPGRAALAERQVRVEHADAVAEAAAERMDDLVRQRDLGHEDEHAPAAGDRGPRRREVDLGLAAAGHAVEQEGGVGARVERARDRLAGRLLGRGQAMRAHRAGAADGARDARLAGHADGRAAGLLARAAAAEALESAGQRRREHAADRRQVVVGDPGAQAKEVGREDDVIADHPEDRLDAGAVGLARGLDDEAPALARAERATHFGAGPGQRLEPGRDGIEEGLANGDGKGDAHEAHARSLRSAGDGFHAAPGRREGAGAGAVRTPGAAGRRWSSRSRGSR